MKLTHYLYSAVIATVLLSNISFATTCEPPKEYTTQNTKTNNQSEYPTMFMCEENGKWGFVDKHNKVIVPAIYDNVWSFKEGMASVSIGDKTGFVDITGSLVIPIQYGFF